MSNEENKKTIEELSDWESSERTTKFDLVPMLEPTPRNMHMLMLKINELVEQVNNLKNI